MKIKPIVFPNEQFLIIFFLIRDLISIGKRDALDIGFLSLDQEKAFDRVDHEYLFKTLEAFGFGSNFVSLIKFLYNNIYSMLRNAPFL